MVAYDWQDEAGCRKHPVSLFFPDVSVGGGGVHAYKRIVAEARKVCLECPVAKECYNCAIANNEEFGVWGGVNFHRHTRIPPSQHALRVRSDYKKFQHDYNAPALARLRDKKLAQL